MQVKKTPPHVSGGVHVPLTEQVSPLLQTVYELVHTLQVSPGSVSPYFPRSSGKTPQPVLIKLNHCQGFLQSFEETFLNIKATEEESRSWGREAGQF